MRGSRSDPGPPSAALQDLWAGRSSSMMVRWARNICIVYPLYGVRLSLGRYQIVLVLDNEVTALEDMYSLTGGWLPLP